MRSFTLCSILALCALAACGGAQRRGEHAARPIDRLLFNLGTGAAWALAGGLMIEVLAPGGHGDSAQAGRVEVLPFLREQAISITAHRFGNPSTLSDGVI